MIPQLNYSLVNNQSALVFEDKLSELPLELVEKIFYYLGKNDIQATICVNWKLSVSGREAANYLVPASLKKFMLSLIQRLNAERSLLQTNSLNGILECITTQNCANLLLLKEYITLIKCKLIDIIKTFDISTEANLVVDLKEQVQFLHIEDIFVLAAFERRIDAAHLIAPFFTGTALKDISIELAQVGYPERATNVASSILMLDEVIPLGPFEKGMFLKDICKVLMKAGHWDEAIIVALSIPSGVPKALILHDIAVELAQAGYPERAGSIAMAIPFAYQRDGALRAISNPSLQTRVIDRAAIVASINSYC